MHWSNDSNTSLTENSTLSDLDNDITEIDTNAASIYDENTELRLENLERGVTLSFVVIAINKLGEGIESSTVSAVL